MAELFFAEPVGRKFDKPIVVKRMLPHLGEDRGFVRMFIEEARISTRLAHPNIVQVFDFEATERGLFLVMELVQGPDLLAVLRRLAQKERALPPELAVYIACHVLEALDYAHGMADDGTTLALVHRDVTPSNILLSRRGHIKLADFGIARAAARQREITGGTLKGKFGYMSPEQIEGGDLDGRSDLFAVGIVLAEMLTGRRMFTAPNDLEILLMVRRADLSRLDKHGSAIPPELDAIVRRALSRDRNKRYATAGDFRDALADWLVKGERRTGAARLAEFLRQLETDGGNLCSWEAPVQATAPTISGSDTQIARLKARRSVDLGRQIFAIGGVPEAPHTDLTASPLVEVDIEVARDPDTALAPAGPEAGQLARTPFVAVLCDIVRERRTGLLTINHGAAHKEAYFCEGHPEFVGSNVAEERFGQFLVRRGVLTPGQLERALAALPSVSGRLGQALVDLGVIGPVDAVQLLTDQVAHKLIATASWNSGTFQFQVDLRNPWPALALHLNTCQIIHRCLPVLPADIPLQWASQHEDHSPTLVDRPPVALAEFGLDGAVQSILRRMDGRTRVAELWRSIPAGPARTRFLAHLYVLERCGIVGFG